MKARLLEAVERQLWTPRSNSARFDLAHSTHDKTGGGDAAGTYKLASGEY
jgi:cobaltochelatase CobN